MAEKVTIMRLKVDLQCEKCYKKVKKVLCKFPQIRDQEFDEKQNIVTIKVVCCSPEKLRDKLCCKGCGAIKSIEIVEPKPKPIKQEKPKPPKTPGTETPKPEKPPSAEPEKVPTPKPSPQPQKPPELTLPVVPVPGTPPPAQVPIGTCCVPCSEGRLGGPCFKAYGRPPSWAPVPRGTCCVPCSEGRPGGPCFEGCGRPPFWVPVPRETCCVPCSEGRPGGPCFEGCGRPPFWVPVPRETCYEGYFYARPIYDSYGGGRPCYVSRCDQYLNEDNATGCKIM